jgi:hypothetical protein
MFLQNVSIQIVKNLIEEELVEYVQNGNLNKIQNNMDKALIEMRRQQQKYAYKNGWYFKDNNEWWFWFAILFWTIVFLVIFKRII